MSPRKMRRKRRAWRVSLGRRAVLAMGWLALIGSITAMALAHGSAELYLAALGAALVAFALAVALPEPQPRRRHRVLRPVAIPAAAMAAYHSHQRPPADPRWSLVRRLFIIP